MFAAASLREVFQELALAFEQRHPSFEVRLGFAGSQELRLQLERGAVADVFASADIRHAKSVVGQGLLAEPAVFARNALVVVVPWSNPAKLTTFTELDRPMHLVVGAPQVPVGAYTEALFRAAERQYGTSFVRKVRANLRSRELNVRQVLAKVSMGEADAGIVYRTDALAMPDKVRVVELPSALATVAEYPIGVLAAAPHAEAARAFVGLVLSEAGQTLLREAGFAAVGPGEGR